MDLPITLSRRDTLVLGLAAAAAPLPAAGADNYPSRSVTIVAPSDAEGPTDIYARAVAEELRRALQQDFFVRDMPGAGTTVGTNWVVHAAPDGYTLLMVNDTQAISETLYAHKPYVLLRDLVAVAPVTEADVVLVVHPSVEAKNLQELLALARDKPGMLNYGSPGYGSASHMAAELLKQITGIDIVHLPDNDLSGMRSHLVNGETQILFDAIPNMAPAIRSGLVRALATGGEKRSPVLPDVPTFAEVGVDFQTSLWLGFMAPKATPQPIIDLLNKTIVRILSRPGLKSEWERQGATPMMTTSVQFTSFIQREIEKWATVIKTNHIDLIN
jgi:tripartite-type tricarboxylate transporter receptor subunit TctC